MKKIIDFLFVTSRPFTVTAPIHHRLKHLSLTNLFGWKPFSSIVFARSAFRKLHTVIDVNERIIEIPWLFSKIDFEKKGKVLDIGYLESTVPFSLATAGFAVTGIDIRQSEIQYPNFTTIVADICDNTLKSNQFDYVILLSTIEHIGLQTVYGTVSSESSDQKAIAECFRVLKPGGKLLITTPIAREMFVNDFMRCYTKDSLEELLSEGNVTSFECYGPSADRAYWKKVALNKLPSPPAFGVALIELVKTHS